MSEVYKPEIVIKMVLMFAYFFFKTYLATIKANNIDNVQIKLYGNLNYSNYFSIFLESESALR